jgi:hypothetical protein
MAVLRLAVPARNAVVAALTALMDADAGGGTVKVYTGAIVATPETAPSGTLLATFTFDPVSFGAPVNGSAALDATPTLDTVGVAAGTAGWARIADASGDTVMDCDVSATGGGGFLQLSTATVSVGLNLSITGGSLSQPM